jgi:hypothetical protein
LMKSSDGCFLSLCLVKGLKRFSEQPPRKLQQFGRRRKSPHSTVPYIDSKMLEVPI